MDLMVKQMRYESSDVLSVILVDPDGSALPAWHPGAHIDLALDGNLRQYSLCGDPADRYSYHIGVHRAVDSRGGSAYLHDVLRRGHLATVSGPRNHFELDESPAYLFVAGGIGITPILPMIAHAQEQGSRWRLVYGGRSLTTMAFLDRLSFYGDHVQLVPQSRDGLIDLEALLGKSLEDTLVYACGPEPLLLAAEERCSSWPSRSLHVERFAAKVQDVGEDSAFEVVCLASGQTVEVAPGVSIVDALEEVDIWIPSACREGICGTCETAVIEGTPDHRDSLLTDEERAAGKVMMTCVSRALSSRLVLDV